MNGVSANVKILELKGWIMELFADEFSESLATRC